MASKTQRDFLAALTGGLAGYLTGGYGGAAAGAFAGGFTNRGQPYNFSRGLSSGMYGAGAGYGVNALANAFMPQYGGFATGPFGQSMANRFQTMGPSGFNPFQGTPIPATPGGAAAGAYTSPFNKFFGGGGAGEGQKSIMGGILPWATLGLGFMGQRSQEKQAAEAQRQMMGEIERVRGTQMTSKSKEFQTLQEQMRQSIRGRAGERGINESPTSVFLEAQALANLQAQMAQQQFLNQQLLLDPTLKAYTMGQQQQPNPLLQMGGQMLMNRYMPNPWGQY